MPYTGFMKSTSVVNAKNTGCSFSVFSVNIKPCALFYAQYKYGSLRVPVCASCDLHVLDVADP